MNLISWLAFIRLLFTSFLSSKYILLIHYCGAHVTDVSYSALTDCLGKTGNNFTLSTLENMSHIGCALGCTETYQCILYFYNRMTRSCSLHSRTLEDIVMATDDSSSCFMVDIYVESWVVEVINVSSSYTTTPPARMIGPPDSVFWAPLNTKESFLEVRVAEMYIEQVHIYELQYVGGVKVISLLSNDDTWFPVWSTEEVESVKVGMTGRIFSPYIEMSHFKTASVRIDIGARLRWEYIDAIFVRGKRQHFT